MAPKKKEEADHTRFLPTQALILCDWTSDTFLPLENSILLPLCGVPLLSYFFTTLRGQNVRTVTLLTKNAPVLEAYIKTWRRENACGRLKMQVVQVPEDSIGDVLRHVHRERIITEDFFLLSPTTITDTIGDVAIEHAKRRTKDNSAIMTKVFAKAPPDLSPLEKLAVMFQEDGEVLHVAPSYSKSAPSQKVIKHFFKDGGKLEYGFEFCDCCVDVCGPEVLDVFADNFDFQDSTNDAFVRLLLSAKFEDELSDQSAYAYFLPDTATVLPVGTIRTLHSSSMQVCKARKTKSSSFNEVYEALTYFTLLPHQSATTASNPQFEADIKCSFIGSNCTIDPSATITRSILLDNVVVEADVEIEDSVIGSNARVHHGSVISLGTIIGNAVCVSAESVLVPFSRLTCDTKVCVDTDPAEEEDEFDEGPLIDNAVRLARGISQLRLESESIGFNVAQWPDVIQEKLNQKQQEHDDEDKGPDEDASFGEYEREVRRMLRALKAEFTQENREAASVELKSYRMSCHESCESTIKAMMPLIVDFIAEAVARGDTVVSAVDLWGPLVKEFRVKDSVEPEITCIDKIQQCMTSHACLGPKQFSQILQKLCTLEVLSDEAIVTWHTKFTAQASQVHEYMEELKPFIAWLTDVSDDSDSDG